MIAIRLNPFSSEFTDKALEEIEKYESCCDEVWLAMYSYEPIETHVKKAEIVGRYIEKLKEKGIRPLIEYGTNLGHGNPVNPDTPDNFEKMRDKNGDIAPDCFCPVGENFLKYQCEVIKLYAAKKPYGIYLDDDLRIELHQNVRLGCFCENCIREFNETNGTNYTLQEISNLIDTDTDFREKYTEMNRRHLYTYAYRMSEAAMSVCPDIHMGWENVFISTATGEDLSPVFKGMYDATKKDVFSRAGAFVYNDNNPRLVLDKVLNTSYQNSISPDYVKVKRPEIENTSHTFMGKTAHGTCVEASLNLAYGNNGLSFSMCQSATEPMEFYGKMWKAFKDHRPYWQGLIDDLDGTGVAGLRPVYPNDAYKANIPGELKWMHAPKEVGRNLIQAGIPISYEDKYCKVYLLLSDIVPYLSDSDIRELLTKNVITDGLVPELLAKRGYSLPVKTAPIGNSTTDIYTSGNANYFAEYYTERSANGEYKNQKGMLDIFCGKHSCQRLIVDGDAEILATADDGKASQVLYTLPEGGKWVTVGSSLRSHMINHTKRGQLLSLINYLSDGLPAYLKNASQTSVIVRADSCGNFKAITLQNISIDSTDDLTVVIRRPLSYNFVLSRPRMKDEALTYELKGDRVYINIPPLAPWTTATVRAL